MKRLLHILFRIREKSQARASRQPKVRVRIAIVGKEITK